MKEMQFSVRIQAPRDTVWRTLWQDKTFRKWASVIDPETYMTGELKEGSEVQFISAANGYGVTSFVEKLIPNEYLLLKHRADTQENGRRGRKEEWTGGDESYELLEKDGATILVATFDVPREMEKYFTINYPKTLEQVKILTEEIA